MINTIRLNSVRKQPQEEKRDKMLPRTVSLTIPTDTRAALAFIMNSCIVSGFSDEHPGGTTGRTSWKTRF